MNQLAFTALLNRLFGAQVLALLQALHIHPNHPATPISNSFAMELLVVLLLTMFFVAVRLRLSVERPGGLQHTMEFIDGFVNNLASETISHHPEKFVPYLTALGMFILSCNLIGLVPGLESPTAVPIVPLGCALFTWFYYHFYGLRTNGPVGYLKHFIGPQEGMPMAVRLFLPVLVFPIEVFSHAARVLSLTVRLFANMFAGEMVTLVFFSLIPLGLPIVFEGLHVGVSFIQTYIFVLLACVYLGEATAHEH
ncbi:MAG TPA: F0F1 ATP synthase subunit A [Candidatus Acidoferrales bacterium]|nr:F0F1 ATP synthase subunit A [Candidatus Acidoferrales bacterium]